ncbi:tRNA pseudouridine synthase, putative [Entamoeba invadens IP1]|uniref:tRNA pseudouridine synthase n=1 Tax=Entamoeba invadens IP1 TaxID=370355 RepID=A0A0A1UBL5_ENTIV|nr:tRNA pseudouridine synthase, putative [Entamoeba invadens IP1]ELP91067.1 tRNA pseudouridine synthase, putative [Entamoeba invadens IP1]|eukprot:XP_004257838.1 tRNA pseudouridine synthase, putative [Entamoeba invadens IP1]
MSNVQPLTNEINQTTEKRETKTKKERVFDFSAFKTRHIAVHLSYVGIGYCGFASSTLNEANLTNYQKLQNDNTIEYYLFQSLFKTKLINSKEDCKYSRCGRTDKDVSGFGQVIDLWVRSSLKTDIIDYTQHDGDYDYCRMINSTLPVDIRCLGWCGVPDDFNSRFSCLSRTYHYYFDPSGYDVEAMKQAAQYFVGEHDFTNFCKKDPAVDHCNRKVLSFEIEPVTHLSRFVVKGTAFLWHQVRYMVGALFLVGSGTDPKTIKDLLDVNNFTKPDFFKYAPAYPLVLFKCEYKEVDFVCDSSNVKLLGDLVDSYKELEIKCLMRKQLVEMALTQKMGEGKVVKDQMELMKKKKSELKPKKITKND